MMISNSRMTDTNRLRLISSRQNSLVKALRLGFHQGELTPDGDCAVDGVKIVEEAIRSSVRITALFVAESARDRVNRLLPQLGNHTETLLLPDDVFRSAVTTETPQGVAALIRVPQAKLDTMLQVIEPLIIVAAGLQDPGNLGTVIRSAEAFGATGIVACDGTVNPHNPKVVRGSAGSIFRLPVLKTTGTAALTAMRERGLRILATSSHKSIPLQEADLTGPLAIIIGNEGSGVPRDLLKEADQVIRVPHSPKVESLNAGIAASVVLYECARQRQ
jgi:TrmH family RNA methyltransferase